MSDSPDLPRIDRRRLLNGAAVLGITAPVLAACGSEEPATSTSPTQADPSDGGSPTADGKANGGSGGGGGGELAATADVPVGGGVILDGEQVVVTQPSEGSFKAFTAVCTHQGCTVTSVQENTINCSCHGSQFSAADGSVVTGPATAPLSEVSVQVEGGNVVRS